MTEKTTDQKDFDLRVDRAIGPVRKKYLELLNQRREELVTQAGGPANVEYEERKKLFDQALQVGQFGQADSKKMAEQWERYNTRPPIGGAKDD